MATRIESQFGFTTATTSYVQVGSDVASGHAWNLLLNVTNIVSTVVKLQAFVVDTSWTTGLPTGGAKVAAIAFDLPIAVGDVVQISGIVLAATQGLVVYSDTASGLDVIACGVDVTL